MRSFKDEAVVIKRRNYGEADRLLTVFTKHNGKLTIKATGVRKIQSRRSSHIELLNHANLALYKGHGMPVLTEVTTISNFPEIKDDLHKCGYAYHICELIDGLCPEDQEQTAVFTLLVDTLNKLSLCHSGDERSEDSRISSAVRDPGQARMTGEMDVMLVIHEFEVELLTLLGYWNQDHANVDTHQYIENILERRLKSKHIFSKLQ